MSNTACHLTPARLYIPTNKPAASARPGGAGGGRGQGTGGGDVRGIAGAHRREGHNITPVSRAGLYNSAISSSLRSSPSPAIAVTPPS